MKPAFLLLLALLNITLAIPIGGGVAYPNSTIYGLVTVSSNAAVSDAVIALRVEPPLRLAYAMGASEMNASTAVWRTSFSCPGDLRAFQVKVLVPPSTPPGAYRVSCIALCNGRLVAAREAFIRVEPAGGAVDLEVLLPCREDGSFDSRYQAFTVPVKEELPPLLSFLLGKEFYSPLLCYVKFSTRSNASMVVKAYLISEDGSIAPFSSLPPGHEGSPGITCGLEGPGSAVVPLYVWSEDPSEVVGDYVLRVIAYAMGTNKVLAEKEVRVRVVAVPVWRILFVLTAALLCIAGMALILGFAIPSFTAREAAVSALFAALAFALVSLPGTIVWPIATAILGPFDWILVGLLYSVALYMIYSSLVTLCPRFGVLTLTMFAKMLLYILFLGSRNPLSTIIWLATSACIYEPLLWLAGVTRGSGAPPWRAAMVFGFGRLIDSYVDFVVYMSLYRLFYADWYILLYCIGSAIYTVIGSYAGAKIGSSLREAWGIA